MGGAVFGPGSSSGAIDGLQPDNDISRSAKKQYLIVPSMVSRCIKSPLRFGLSISIDK
jgi:hypothetical protein